MKDMKGKIKIKPCVPDSESTKMWAKELGIKEIGVTEFLLNLRREA